MKKKATARKAPAVSLQTKLDNLILSLERSLYSAADSKEFLEDLGTLVDDGVPANKAVEVMSKLTKGPTKKLCESILLKIAQGRPIADGMIGWIPQHIVELIRAGESGGTLGENMHAAAESLGRSTSTLGSLAASLIYPSVVLITGICVLIYMNGSIFAQFEAIKPLSQWPQQGRNLVAMAIFFENYWWVILFAMLGIFILLSKILKDTIGPVRKYIDAVPPLNLYKRIAAARFMETLGLLIANGVVFKQALRIMQYQATPYMAWHLMLMERRLSRGSANIADVLDTNMVERGDVLRLRAIADVKGFEHALVRLGKQAAERSVETIKKIGKIAGGLLLAVGAGLAGYMVTGIYAVGSSLT